MDQKTFFKIVVLLFVTIILAVIFIFTHDPRKGIYAFPVPGHTYGKPCLSSADCNTGEVCEGSGRLGAQKVCALDYKPNF